MLYFFSLQVRGWRALLASHLPAIQRELASTFWGFPSFATTLDGLTKKVDMVQQWVEVAYSASLVLHQADQSMQLFPPTVLRWLRQKCTHALTPIESRPHHERRAPGHESRSQHGADLSDVHRGARPKCGPRQGDH